MNETIEATAIFAPLWKRKWLILVVGILVAAGTYEYYKGKPTIYTVATQLYLGSGAEEEGLVNGGGKKASVPNAANQTALINSALIHEVVVRKLRNQHAPVANDAIRGKVRAKSAEKSEFITLTAEAHTPRATALLANTTAQTYITRQNDNYQRGIRSAIALTRQQLRKVEAGLNPVPTTKTTKGAKAAKPSGSASTSATLQAATLSTKINQLESQLSTPGVKQIGLARPTATRLLSPMPRKNTIFGFLIGIVLASIAAYTLSRFDRRLRSLAAIESVYGTHILAALPSVRRPIVRRDGQLRPSKSFSEPLRRLHTSLGLGEMLGRDRVGAPRSILFVSPDAGDGKSTVIATLALVQRDAGERVAVIEADFRRPVQARLLGVDGPHGLADVLSGALALDEAMQTVTPPQQEANLDSQGSAAGVATVVESRSSGALSVLVGGNTIANPPALLADRTMTEVLRSAAEDFDHVLVDAPPPLQVSDVMPLLPSVDGIVLVARVGHTREASAQRLMQLLARTPSAPVLGVVANDVPGADLERYGFSSGPPQQRWPGKLFGR